MSDSMSPHETMIPGEERRSANGNARLVFQGDGNLVLYVRRPVGEVPRWHSATHGQPATTCVMQDDGNLVLYTAANQPLWASGTHGNPGAALVVQDDENCVIYAPGGRPVWASDTWIGNWVSSRPAFDPTISGFRFRNSFVDPKLHGITLNGLCGGMSFAALDYHHAGFPAPNLARVPPTEGGNPLGSYIKGRHIQSLGNPGAAIVDIILAVLGIPLDLVAGLAVASVPNYNGHQFLGLLSNPSDQALRDRSMGDEWRRLRAAIDAGTPVPLGLFAAGGLTDSHQVVACGYRDGVHDRWIQIYDPNHPESIRELWVSRTHSVHQTSGETWRGFFVEQYALEKPPRIGIDEALALDRRVFDAGFYLRIYDDLTAAFGVDAGAAANHWLTFGTREGRRASTVLDPPYYLSHHPDLVQAFGVRNHESAVEHFVHHGIGEGRRSSLEFDVAWYLANHADLVNAFGANNYQAAVDHWNNHGMNEGRRSSADFDVGHYLGAHADLVNAFGANGFAAAFEHWLRHGRHEGRRPIP